MPRGYRKDGSKCGFQKGHPGFWLNKNIGPWTGKKRPGISGKNNNMWKGGKQFNNGYIEILSKNHPHKTTHGYVREHRLVMEKHLGRYLKPSEHIHHINGTKLDNRIENLRLFKDGSQHMKFHHPKGKSFCGHHVPKGEKHYRTKFTENDIIEIRRLHIPRKYNQIKLLAKKFCVSRRTITSILNRKNWKHI